jgi:hypothetical protein
VDSDFDAGLAAESDQELGYKVNDGGGWDDGPIGSA